MISTSDSNWCLFRFRRQWRVRSRTLISSIAVPLVFCFLTTEALAQNGARFPATRFVGVRPAAMGNAFTAVVDDQNALYYNPAGLAKQPNWSLEIIAPFAGLNENVVDNTQDVRDILESSKGGSGGKSDVVESLGPIIEAVSGENHYLRAGIAPYFVMPQYGIGAYVQVESELVPRGQVVPTIVDFSFQGDTDVRVGYAHEFFGKKLAVGSTVAYRERVQILGDKFSLFQLTAIAKNEENRKKYVEETLRAGYGIGVDAGVLFTPVEMWSPTLGVSLLNVGDTSFQKGGFSGKKVSDGTNGQSGVPTSVPQSLNFGLSLTPTFGNWITRAAFDYADANLPIPASQKPSFGVEGGWRGKFVSALLQSGFAEGYLSAGFEFRLLILNIRYATYVTERGYFPTQSPERRHLMQVKLLL